MKVSITGEAYFEVVKDKQKPFLVQSRDQIIEVVGTHFNVNAYSDEDKVATTLLEGMVKVWAGKGSTIIQPGEQLQVKTSAIRLVEVEADDAVSWKNGLFHFRESDIETVMRQFSRWYDVKVIYQGEVPRVSITGKVYRNTDLSKALEILTILNIHYRIKDRTITIMR